MRYSNLREKVTAENRDRMQKDKEALHSTGEDAHIQDNLLSNYLTKQAYTLYKSGELLLEKAIIKASKAIEKEYDKRLEKLLAKIEAVELTEFAESITISVEWKKNSTWGANPTATVRARHGYESDNTTGTASGCGYDKESASVASAFNQCPSIMKILYSRIEEELIKNCTIQYAKEIFPYGSGYTLLPYFEGGVGISCFQTIFEFCGYNWKSVGSGKMFNCYLITRGNK